MAKEKLTYNSAIRETEEILKEIENNETDIDQLSAKVKRVTYLLDFCKNKLQKTEEDIEKIINQNDK